MQPAYIYTLFSSCSIGQNLCCSSSVNKMSLSAQGPRPPYPLPPPPGTGRLSSFPATYSSQSFSSQLHSHQHHHYLSTPSSQPGFTFPNSMLLPGSQPSVISPAPGTNSSMPLSTSPVCSASLLYTNGLIACILLQGQDSNDGLLDASSVPTPRRQSVSSHGSPIPPNSPILEVETPAEYKICNYRSGVSSSAVNSFGISSSAVNSFGINSSVNSFGMSAPPPPPPPPFGSFPSAPQQTPSSLHMPCGLGYPGPPAAMCPTSMYTAQEAMCNGTPPLGLSMWK